MSLTVLSVAYPLAPVGRDTAGGAEQVLAALDRGLVEAGHRSVVIAQEGSTVAGELVPIPAPAGALDDAARREVHDHVRRALREAIARGVDLVHLHGADFHHYLPPPGPTALVTLHMPHEFYPPEALRPARPDTWFNTVSADQARRYPALPTLIPPIANGIPVAALQARHAPRGFALSLGRICPEKGQHLALEAARRADVPLVLAGEVFAYEAHEAYFRDEIAPALDRQRRFVGPVGFRRKRRLLTAARCLLVTSLVHETSSLVAREALACGTPVIAFARGALAEAVEDGVTGFLVEDVDGMAQAIAKVGRLDRERCRIVARERFDEARMVDRYLAAYRSLTDRGRAGAA